MRLKNSDGSISLGFNLRLLACSFFTKFLLRYLYSDIFLKWRYNAHFTAGIGRKYSAAHVLTRASLVIASLKSASVLAALADHTNLSWLMRSVEYYLLFMLPLIKQVNKTKTVHIISFIFRKKQKNDAHTNKVADTMHVKDTETSRHQCKTKVTITESGTWLKWISMRSHTLKNQA